MNYTTKRIRTIDDIDGELATWLIREGERVSKIFGGEFDAHRFDFLTYARDGYFLVCFRRGQPVGIMLARLYESIFDDRITILCQDLLYVSEGSGRAAHILMREFIDFGKSNANHILTQVTLKTRIKGKSLEKLGFKKIEELYRIEV